MSSGDPKDYESAKFLAENDKYQFEWWAIRMLGAQGKEYKKGADRGIDGIVNFTDGAGEYKRAVISVKGGASTPGNALRDLRGTMEREKAVSGILVTLVPPTGPMKREMADAGRWTSTLHPDRSFPVLQVLSAQDLLDGKLPEIPTWGMDTGTRAKKVVEKPEQGNMFDE
ncbi:MAG TPA: restriction endonuclease [Fimbriimonadaceae bacterium]|nr:restriction endonuclease [Fimbriimonadaceae bacterium]